MYHPLQNSLAVRVEAAFNVGDHSIHARRFDALDLKFQSTYLLPTADSAIPNAHVLLQ